MNGENLHAVRTAERRKQLGNRLRHRSLLAVQIPFALMTDRFAIGRPYS
jgi:hypothetical protein